MTTSTQPLTELQAVNTMLAAVFEAPVNTLDSAGTEDVAIAQRMLGDKVREVLLKGIASNVETNVVLTPDANTKQIPLPNNVLRVDSTASDGADVVQRGLRLYDRGNHTFLFDRAVRVEIYYLLEWSELPEHIKYPIAVLAARRFQNHVLGQNGKGGYDERDELDALALLSDADTDMEDSNMLTDSWSVSSILDRESYL